MRDLRIKLWSVWIIVHFLNRQEFNGWSTFAMLVIFIPTCPVKTLLIACWGRLMTAMSWSLKQDAMKPSCNVDCKIDKYVNQRTKSASFTLIYRVNLKMTFQYPFLTHKIIYFCSSSILELRTSLCREANKTFFIFVIILLDTILVNQNGT